MTLSAPSPRFFPIVRWILLAQGLVVLLSGLLGALFAGGRVGLSAGLGGLLALVPNLCFAWRFGVRDDRRTARQVVRSFYLGETVKLALTVSLFAVVLQWPFVHFPALLSGFVLVLSVLWLSLLVRGAK